jgi:hypothetical protein
MHQSACLNFLVAKKKKKKNSELTSLLRISCIERSSWIDNRIFASLRSFIKQEMWFLMFSFFSVASLSKKSISKEQKTEEYMISATIVFPKNRKQKN